MEKEMIVCNKDNKTDQHAIDKNEVKLQQINEIILKICGQYCIVSKKNMVVSILSKYNYL